MNRIGYGIGMLARRSITGALTRKAEQGSLTTIGLKRYNEWLEKKPVMANLMTGLALGMAGDLICQFAVEQKTLSTFDWRRFVGMASFSGFYASTFSLKIFSLYPKILPASIMKSHWREGIASSILDCLVHSPLLYLPVFYLWTGKVNGDSVQECFESYRDQFVPVMTSLLLVWIPVQAINFSVIPRSQRVVFVCGANLVWNCILDFLAHSEGTLQ